MDGAHQIFRFTESPAHWVTISALRPAHASGVDLHVAGAMEVSPVHPTTPAGEGQKFLIARKSSLAQHIRFYSDLHESVVNRGPSPREVCPGRGARASPS